MDLFSALGVFLRREATSAQVLFTTGEGTMCQHWADG